MFLKNEKGLVIAGSMVLGAIVLGALVVALLAAMFFLRGFVMTTVLQIMGIAIAALTIVTFFGLIGNIKLKPQMAGVLGIIGIGLFFTAPFIAMFGMAITGPVPADNSMVLTLHSNQTQPQLYGLKDIGENRQVTTVKWWAESVNPNNKKEHFTDYMFYSKAPSHDWKAEVQLYCNAGNVNDAAAYIPVGEPHVSLGSMSKNSARHIFTESDTKTFPVSLRQFTETVNRQCRYLAIGIKPNAASVQSSGLSPTQVDTGDIALLSVYEQVDSDPFAVPIYWVTTELDGEKKCIAVNDPAQCGWFSTIAPPCNFSSQTACMAYLANLPQTTPTPIPTVYPSQTPCVGCSPSPAPTPGSLPCNGLECLLQSPITLIAIAIIAILAVLTVYVYRR